MTSDGYNEARALNACGIATDVAEGDAGFESKPVKNKGAECITDTQLLRKGWCDACISNDDMFSTAIATSSVMLTWSPR